MMTTSRILALIVLLAITPLVGCKQTHRAVRRDRGMPAGAPHPMEGSDYLLYATFDRATPDLRYAASRNGYTWQAVQGGRGYFTEPTALRDPTVVRGPDGVFHCVYTTAHPYSIGYISSRDLVNWSPPRWLHVMGHEPRTRVCWAPELIWDRARSEWLIIWSSDVAGEFRVDKDTEQFIHRFYACTTKDFVTFSPTWLFFDPGHNIIDPQMVEHQGRYYLFYKDERLNPDRKVILVTEASDPRGPFAPGRPTIPNAPIEGTSALPFVGSMIVYFDAYVDNEMGAMLSTDMVNWRDISEQVAFPRGHRHGSVLRVTPAEFDRVINAPTAGAIRQ